MNVANADSMPTAVFFRPSRSTNMRPAGGFCQVKTLRASTYDHPARTNQVRLSRGFEPPGIDRAVVQFEL
jgi:hypothetical protein